MGQGQNRQNSIVWTVCHEHSLSFKYFLKLRCLFENNFEKVRTLKKNKKNTDLSFDFEIFEVFDEIVMNSTL